MHRALITTLVAIALFSPATLLAQDDEILKLSSQILPGIERSGRKAVAVADFTDLRGNLSELGRFLAEEFSVVLSQRASKVVVTDRAHLSSLLAEHKLAPASLTDPKTVKQLKRIAAVDVLITGALTVFTDAVRLSVKAIDTETAAIISASSGSISRTQSLNELLARDIPSLAASQPSSAESGGGKSSSLLDRVLPVIEQTLPAAKPSQPPKGQSANTPQQEITASSLVAGDIGVERENGYWRIAIENAVLTETRGDIIARTGNPYAASSSPPGGSIALLVRLGLEPLTDDPRIIYSPQIRSLENADLVLQDGTTGRRLDPEFFTGADLAIPRPAWVTFFIPKTSRQFTLRVHRRNAGRPIEFSLKITGP